MRISKIGAACSLFFLLAIPCPLPAQQKNPKDLQKSCLDFVQNFYDWYAPKTQEQNAGNTSDLALKYRSSAFSPELARQLRADSDAQAKVAGDIVGLDFDPFVNSQDPDERYVVGKITVKGDSYWVEVHSIRSGKKREKPVVVAELMLKDGRWRFVNFHYGERDRSTDENLLSTLKSLRESRQKEPK